ncbi:tRNA (cytidine32/uridine32-2'-O)-methyltransferase [Steroidobacter denitrificans]|uniref:tRNA (cytidine/uridine-2'-O-)-methyltransferase TrmJ n=1 Tax=Steroidobacter denitrificans TaxID=465721 RepID=A0A127FAZ3_STEDE|nr:RNA methyltransferase [Steroidobacter denitrificans]AMN46765.1 tRNA (cytidine32/uridine32-2'-O)-methyltransferase [Steroidobacter denitrificans]
MSIRIVLVETRHPGNIGAAARAMKNMGLQELHLVRPRSFPDPEASARASGADDLLETAQVHEHLEDAIAACGLVVGSSARQRYLSLNLLEPRECAARIVQASRSGKVAIVFGTERTGLTNAELAHCNLLATIPTDSRYSSLNLAMAVQVFAYELWLAMRPGAPLPAPLEVPLATGVEMTRLYKHIEQVLEQVEFRDRTGGGYLMARIRRLFNRAQVDQNEMNILRGILTAVQSKRRPAGNTVESLPSQDDGMEKSS